MITTAELHRIAEKEGLRLLKELPEFDLVWKEWTKTFRKMTGKKE